MVTVPTEVDGDMCSTPFPFTTLQQEMFPITLGSGLELERCIDVHRLPFMVWADAKRYGLISGNSKYPKQVLRGSVLFPFPISCFRKTFLPLQKVCNAISISLLRRNRVRNTVLGGKIAKDCDLNPFLGIMCNARKMALEMCTSTNAVTSIKFLSQKI